MPFDDLPIEIIQYIFSLCCRSVNFRVPQEADRSRSGTTQVTISLVCSRWREIALNTSALWGDVVVIYEAGKERRRPTASFQAVHNWLNRARMTPISLSISVYEALESQIAAISQTLLSSFHVTYLDVESFHSPLLVPTNTSRIERLYLSLYEPARTTDIFPRLPEMPSLQDLRLCLYPGDYVDLTNIYLIPWHQLHIFKLCDNSWPSQMLFNILQRCESLVICTLLMSLEHGQLEHNIILPNLESLMLEMNADGSADPIIRSLTVPNLRSLELRSQRPWRGLQLSLETIVMMAHRSGFGKRLTNFSLCLTEEAVDVRLLLGSMPALEAVQLLGPLMFQPGTFDSLSSGTIAPQVEDIHFGVMSDEEIALLLEAVGQRHEKAKTVSHVRPFAFVVAHCTSESNLESHKQRAKQCGEAFDAHVSIARDLLVLGMIVDSDESDSDFSLESFLDEESYIDEEPLEESNSSEESHSFGGPESHEESHSFEDSSSESHWESDPDVGSDSHSDEGSDPASDDV